MSGHEYRDRIAAYVHTNFSRFGLTVYTEVALGKSIIGKRRTLDVFMHDDDERRALGLECKFQGSTGTTDEKIWYSLADVEAMWIPGCLVYAGTGWSQGVLHTLEGSRHAAYCDPAEDNARTRATEELDHIIAAVFALWSEVIPTHRRFAPDAQLDLPVGRILRSSGQPQARTRKKRST